MALFGGALAATWAHGEPPPWWMDAPVNDGPGAVVVLALFGLAAVTVKTLAGGGAAWAQASLAARLGASLRRELVARVLGRHEGAPLGQGDQGARRSSGPGDVGRHAAFVHASTGGVQAVEAALSTGVLLSIRSALGLLPLALVLFALSARLFVGACFVAVVFGPALRWLRRRLAAEARHAHATRQRLLEVADEATRRQDVWITFGATGRVLLAIDALSERLRRASARWAGIAFLQSGANEWLAAVVVLGLAWLGFAGAVGELADARVVLPFFVVFFMAYRPLRDWGDARAEIERARVAIDELAWLGQPDGAPLAESPPVRTQARTDWALEALRVRELELVRGSLAPVSFDVEPGQVAQIVAPTGAGKTTLLRVLLGLELPERGVVRWGDRELSHGQAGPGHRPCAWLPQDAPLVADTLESNIAMADPLVDWREALHVLGAERLVALGGQRLGDGLRELSGGERRLVALARALGTGAPLLLLDEPLEGLDQDAQASVAEALRRLRGRRSLLVVSHRPLPDDLVDVSIELAPSDAE